MYRSILSKCIEAYFIQAFSKTGSSASRAVFLIDKVPAYLKLLDLSVKYFRVFSG